MSDPPAASAAPDQAAPDRTALNRTAWFNCHAGVAGDMTMAALVDAGADQDTVANIIAGLGVAGYALYFERVQRCGVGATWANVVTHDNMPANVNDDDGGAATGDPNGDHTGDESADGHSHGHTHRPASEIFKLLATADIPERVRSRATAVFRRLADVEGAIHGIDPNDVELHEVGALDSIVDVVGVCAALEALDIDAVRCSSIGLGSGTVKTAHGVLPHPAPATMALLTQAGVPTHGLPTTLETATPTGAALMTTLSSSFGSIAAGSARAVGYGAGTADTEGRANVVQVVIVEHESGSAIDADGEAVTHLETNVDDVTGEVLAHTVAVLMDAGAHDAWLTPIVMKKGRPAHTVHVLCDPSRATELRDVMLRETGSLGVRASTMRRWPQAREFSSVEVDGHSIGVKVSEHRVKVEFDDAAAAAAALGIPVRMVIDRATTAAARPS